MATASEFDIFTEHLCKGVHNLTSDSTCTLTIALCAAANEPNLATHSVLADLTQISYTNLSTRVFANVTLSRSGGQTKITADDLVLTASGGAVATFRYGVIYNDDPTSPADPLMWKIDFGSDRTLNDGDSLTIDILAAGIATVGTV